jgi:hypothetical protein
VRLTIAFNATSEQDAASSKAKQLTHFLQYIIYRQRDCDQDLFGKNCFADVMHLG